MTSVLPKLFTKGISSSKCFQSFLLVKRLECPLGITAFEPMSTSSKATRKNINHSESLLQKKNFYKFSNNFNLFCSIQRKAHTNSDHNFSSMLMDEIKAEKERMLEIPQVSQGWKLTRNGADCKLTKMLNQDHISVSFNVNASIPPVHSEDPDEEQEIIAQPDFSVEIKKPSSESLTFECYFPEDIDKTDQVRDNVFSIRSVILHRGEVVESTYIMDTENVDPALYESMLNYLKDRGIGNEFAEEIVDIATAI